MQALFNQLRELPRMFGRLPASVRFGIFAGLAVLAVLTGVGYLGGSSGAYEYAFTNLSAEDSAEAAAHLKSAKIPFKLEAGGTALSVPASQVYDARLMLATAGLPRGGGVGFEIFDRGDLGVSEFTQRVNLRRATEGELSRTISRLAAVRSARVHVTMPEKGLYRDEDRRAAAAVVLNLQPGRAMADRELAGIRHLVASAVTGLSPEGVTIVDGRGTVLAGDSSPSAKAAGEQHEMERKLEQRVIELLEPAVGPGAIVAKVTAAFDSSEVDTINDTYDPEAIAVRSEHRTNEQTQQDSSSTSGVAGAAANQPLANTPAPGGGSNRGQTQREDETKNYEISKTTTHTVTRGSRLRRLSVAVLLDSPAGKPLAEAEMKRLEALAKGAVGFDAARGDQFQISAAAFARPPEDAAKPSLLDSPRIMRIAQIVGGVVLLLIALLAVSKMRATANSAPGMAMLKPGARVGELEAMMDQAALGPMRPAAAGAPALADPNAAVRDRARELARTDPARAAHLLRAWINSDSEQRS